MTRAKTFDLLIQQYQKLDPEDQADTSLGEYIAENFELLGVIRNGLITYRTDKLDLEADYKQQRENLEQRLRQLRARCPHLDVTYHPDPSGNNDSWRECNLCGAEV